jgi:hypothetical protein
MSRLKLSQQAKDIVRELVQCKDSNRKGYIAIVDPDTGEVYYGKNVREAAKEGRRAKNNPKAVFSL